MIPAVVGHADAAVVRVQGVDRLPDHFGVLCCQVRRPAEARFDVLEVPLIEQNKILPRELSVDSVGVPRGHELGHALLALRRVFVHGRHFSLGFRR